MPKIIRLIPAICWMAFIFFLSSQQTIGIGETRTERFLILKSFHLIEYAVLYFLFSLASLSPLSSASLSYTYALSDELHQHFIPGREGKFVDTLVDLLGISLGFLAFKIYQRIRQRLPFFRH